MSLPLAHLVGPPGTARSLLAARLLQGLGCSSAGCAESSIEPISSVLILWRAGRGIIWLLCSLLTSQDHPFGTGSKEVKAIPSLDVRCRQSFPPPPP